LPTSESTPESTIRPSKPKPTLIEVTLGLLALLLLVAGCIFVLRPFLSALILAIVLCFSTWPWFVALLNLMNRRKTLAALAMTLLLALIILAPFAFLGAHLVDNVKAVMQATHRALVGGPPQPPEWLAKIPIVGPRARDYWVNLSADVSSQAAALQSVIGTLAKLVLEFGAVLGHGLFDTALALLICFFLYRDGDAAAKRLTIIAFRIGGPRVERLIDIAALTVRSVVYGFIGTSLIQGVLFGLGFWLAGVPGPTVLGFATFILSFVPIGAAAIWVPAAIWLFRQSSPHWAIFILCWGMLVGGLLEHALRPILMARTGATPLILILLGVFGGALAFGFVGFFIGPTLLAVGYSLLQEWGDDKVETAVEHSPDLLDAQSRTIVEHEPRSA
jgi:predicted PurR-regulated permease PerM